MSTSLTPFEIYTFLKKSRTLTASEAKQLAQHPETVTQVLLSSSMDEEPLDSILYDIIRKDPNAISILLEIPSHTLNRVATFYCALYNTHTTWTERQERLWKTLISAAYAYEYRYPERLTFNHLIHPLFLKHIDVLSLNTLRNAFSDIRNHRNDYDFADKIAHLQPHIHIAAFQEYIHDAPQAWMLDCVHNPKTRTFLMEELSFEECINSPCLVDIILSRDNDNVNQAMQFFQTPESLKELFFQQWHGHYQEPLRLLPIILKTSALQDMIGLADYPPDIRYACWLTSDRHIDDALTLYPEYREAFLEMFNQQCQNPGAHYPLECVLDPDFDKRNEDYQSLTQQNDFSSDTDQKMSYNEMLLMYHGYVWPFGNYNKTPEIDLHFSL